MNSIELFDPEKFMSDRSSSENARRNKIKSER